MVMTSAPIDPVAFAQTQSLVGVVPTTILNETDSGQKITNAIAAARLAGTCLSLQAGVTYNMQPRAAQAVGGSYVIQANYGCVLVPPGVDVRGNGATLAQVGGGQGGASLMGAYGDINFNGVVTGAMAVTGQPAVFQLATVADAANYAVGNTVRWRLGDVSYDLPETWNWGFALVTAVDTTAGTVTINRPLVTAWDGTGTNNKHLAVVTPISQRFDDLTFTPPSPTSGAQGGLVVTNGLRTKVGRIKGVGCYAGTWCCQYVEDFDVQHVEAIDNPSTGSNQGQAVRIAESSGHIGSIFSKNCGNQVVDCEDACRVVVDYAHDINLRNGTNGARTLFTASGNSLLHIENFFSEGFGGATAAANLNGGKVTFGTYTSITATDPYTLPCPGTGDVRRLSLTSVGGSPEVYCADQARWFEQIIPLTDGMSVIRQGPPGIIAACYIYGGGGAAAADLSDLRIGRSGSGSNSITSALVAGTDTQITNQGGLTVGSFGAIGGGFNWTYRAKDSLIYVATATGTTLAGSGKYIRVRMLVVPNLLASPTDTPDSTNVLSERYMREVEGLLTAQSPTVAAGAYSSTFGIGATGSAVGDFALVTCLSSLSGLEIRAVEATTNGINFKLYNPTSASISLSSVTFRGRAQKSKVI